MHRTCARNTWCEHAPLPLPLPLPPRLTGCHSHLQTTSEPPTHVAPLHSLLSPTSPLPPGCRGGRTLSSWSSVGHVGWVSKATPLQQRGVYSAIQILLVGPVMSCLYTHQYMMVLAETFVMKNLFCSLQFCPLLQRLSAVFLPKTCE